MEFAPPGWVETLEVSARGNDTRLKSSWMCAGWETSENEMITFTRASSAVGLMRQMFTVRLLILNKQNHIFWSLESNLLQIYNSTAAKKFKSNFVFLSGKQ